MAQTKLMTAMAGPPHKLIEADADAPEGLRSDGAGTSLSASPQGVALEVGSMTRPSASA